MTSSAVNRAKGNILPKESKTPMKLIVSVRIPDVAIEELNMFNRFADKVVKEEQFVYYINEPHDLMYAIQFIERNYNTKLVTIYEDELNHGYYRMEF